MTIEDIKKYINNRYERWLDYAKYHCSCAGIEDETIDVLNEVMCDLLQKPDHLLLKLYSKKSGQYTELDYYVLRMIKLNATSNTSPYKHRYKALPIDNNVDYARMELEDIESEDQDRAGDILKKMKQIRIILDELCLSNHAKSVFMWRMSGESWTDWQGPETPKQLFDIFYKVRNMVRQRLKNESFF